MNILLVEDSAIAAMAAKELLIDQLACRVDVAETGEKAIQLAKSKKYQYIFMDIGLPDISGFDVTRQIKTDSRNQHIPIIALTGNTNAEIKIESQIIGICEILEKPLTAKKLKSVFARLKSAEQERNDWRCVQ
jgi:two-component system aerobic respiration control sensor histidine kinase ArcB